MAAPIGFTQDAQPIFFVEIATGGNTFKYQKIATNAEATGFARNTTSTYIAVCKAGLIYRTTNITLGVWTLVFTAPNNVDLLDIAFGSGIFVAVGRSGTILSSNDDGLTWSVRTSGTTSNLQRVYFGNAMFLAVGDTNTLRYSNAAATVWNASTITALGTNTYNVVDIVWTNSRWVAIGNNVGGAVTIGRLSITGGFAMSSPDGIIFTIVSIVSGFIRLNSIAFNSTSQLVVAADYGLFYTSDATGANWTIGFLASYDNLSLIRYINNQYILINRNGVIYTSINGTTYTEVTKISGFVFDIYFDTLNYYFLNANQIAISTLVGLDYFRVTTAPIDLIYNGIRFTSDQRLTGIGRVTQSIKNDGSQFNLQFAGQDYTLRDEFFSYNLQDKMLTVWVASGNSNWESGPLAVWFKGYINSIAWDVNVATTLNGTSDSLLTIGCKDLVSRLKNTLAGRPANPGGMKRFFPSDTSHDQLAAERDRVVTLGKGVAQ